METTKKRLTREEYRATLPKKLNKLGEWMVAHYGEEPDIVINDMKAVLK